MVVENEEVVVAENEEVVVAEMLKMLPLDRVRRLQPEMRHRGRSVGQMLPTSDSL